MKIPVVPGPAYNSPPGVMGACRSYGDGVEIEQVALGPPWQTFRRSAAVAKVLAQRVRLLLLRRSRHVSVRREGGVGDDEARTGASR